MFLFDYVAYNIHMISNKNKPINISRFNNNSVNAKIKFLNHFGMKQK